MSAKPILRELEDWRSRAATDRDWDRGREVDLLGEIIDRLAAAIAKTTEPVKPSVELLPCPLCKGRVLDNTTQHDLEKQVACEFCTFTCSMADWNRAAARGEVAVTAQEAVPVAFVRWVEDDAQGGNGGPKLVWNPKFDGWSLTKPDGTPQDCALYITAQAAVPISELRALREKWDEVGNAAAPARCGVYRHCARDVAALCAKFGE